MESYKKYWLAVVAVLLIGFGFLGYWGRDVYHEAPPVPTAYVTSSGETLFTKDDILHGQTAWQTTGGQEVGTVLGHGAYQAPDWTADWLHREITEWLDLAAQDQYGAPYEALSDSQQAALRQELHDEYRGAQVDENGVVVLSDRRVQAMNDTADYYIRLYGDDPTLHMSRDHFAMKNNTLPDLQDRIDMTHFFFWTTWIASAERPGAGSTYTSNWPHEPLLGNVPTTENVIWSIASIVSLLLGIGLFVWFWAFCRNKKEEPVVLKPADPILKMSLTPSQKALWKYVLVVVCLFMLQLMCGGLVAHYTVEGQSFYGIPLGEWIPYSVVRTWHLQLAMFWIAVAFLTMGLFLAPLMNGGKDPKGQKLGVNILFVALVVLVLGALGGSYLAIYHILPEQWSFYLGHQGYEYLDLGRIWQAIEYIGILFWLLLMLRSAVQALRQPGDKHLTIAF
ncbi:MAG: cbb3-type cytochrome c oxidase subunit I, partial [Veillonella sp.]|nr:cbb3-type cytochrome c oxidase subunit I [Veillonella sp.]